MRGKRYVRRILIQRRSCPDAKQFAPVDNPSQAKSHSRSIPVPCQKPAGAEFVACGQRNVIDSV